MSRRRLAMAAVAAVLAVAVAVLAGRALEPTGAPQHGWTVAQLETELMCPTCKTRLDMSDQPVANQIRARLGVAQRAGWSKSRVEAYLVNAYGEAVLASPPHHGFGLLAWLVPAVAVLLGGLVAAWLVRRWAARPRGEMPLELALSSAERDRLERVVDADLEQFE